MVSQECSNWTLKWINVITAVLSLPIIIVGIYLATASGSACFTFLQKPVFVIGFFMLFLSVLGWLGSESWGDLCLFVYLFLMGILILLLTIFVIFAFAVTSNNQGYTVAGHNFTYYKIEDTTSWLQSQINGTDSWNGIRSCMVAGDYCNHLDTEFSSLSQYNSSTLSPTEAGCCRPPTDCGFTQTNYTTFVNTANASSFSDADCLRWSNNITIACYNCDTCKGGVAHYLQQSWRTGAYVLLIFLIFLIIIYSIGCCVRFNSDKAKMGRMVKKVAMASQAQVPYGNPSGRYQSSA